MTDLNRAWSRVGALGGTFMGRAITPLWGEEQAVTFSRTTAADDHGTFEDGWMTPYWTTRGQVDMSEPAREQALAQGVVQHVVLRVFVRPPEDSTLTPKKGDDITWTDPSGTQRTNRIAAVIDPRGLHSHLEIESEALD